MVHGHALAQLHAIVFLGLVGDDDQFAHAFGEQAVHDLQHRMAFGPLAHALTARHGYGVVVEHLVGDVGAGRDALADGQQPAVEIGAVAQIGEDMGLCGEGAWPTQVTPSPPICVKVLVRRSGIQVVM